jgi:hypothetical protein
MRLMRISTDRSTTAYSVLFLCLCVFMQLLGATMTLWDLDIDLDPVNAPLLEGFSLPTSFPNIKPAGPAAFFYYSIETARYLLRTHHLFRPPNSLS